MLAHADPVFLVELDELDDAIDQDAEEEPLVQVRTDSSAWHRPAIGGRFTACGEPLGLTLPVGSLRVASYLGELCRKGCFGTYELEESDRLNQLRRTSGDH